MLGLLDGRPVAESVAVPTDRMREVDEILCVRISSRLVAALHGRRTDPVLVTRAAVAVVERRLCPSVH